MAIHDAYRGNANTNVRTEIHLANLVIVNSPYLWRRSIGEASSVLIQAVFIGFVYFAQEVFLYMVELF